MQKVLESLKKVLFPEFYAPDQDENALRSAAFQQIQPWMGEEKGEEFFARLPNIRQRLAEDLQAAVEGDPAAEGPRQVALCYPGFYAVTVYRLAHALVEMGVATLPRMMTEQAHSVTGIDIHPGAQIGRFFFIDHGTGVVIGQTTVIGDRVTLYQGVTLGALSTRGGQRLQGVKRHPTVEDDVVIYANATVLGGGTVIGRGAVIGANTFVTASVPPGARVSVEPRQVVRL